MSILMDQRTEKLLGIERVLSELHPATPFGIRCKSEMKPFLPHERESLEEELNRIEVMQNLIESQKPVFSDIKSEMRAIKDIRKSIERAVDGGVLNQVEFFELKNLAYTMGVISKNQQYLHWDIPEKYRIQSLTWVNDILDPERTGLKTFYIYDAYSETLSHIRRARSQAEQQYDRLKKQLVQKIQEELQIEIRASGEITVSKNNKPLIEALKAHPDIQTGGETYVNALFKIKPDETMLGLLKETDSLKEAESLEEVRILEALSRKIGERGGEIIKNMEALGAFDLLMAKAALATAYKAVKPRIIDAGGFKLEKGRHPIVEAGLRKKGKVYTPISINLTQGAALITGANMGGKTVSLKLLGLLAAMMQYGLLVPAESLETGLFDFIFISAGDEQSIDLGLSTFGAEMKGIKEVLQKAKQGKGMILIDELARGTNPHEGYAISSAIIDYLRVKPSISIITTHFDGLVKKGVLHLQVKGLKNKELEGLKDIKNLDIIGEYMDYSLVEVQGETEVPRDAIRISRIMGIPEEILQEAEWILRRSHLNPYRY